MNLLSRTILLPALAIALGHNQASGQPFVQSAVDREKIEQALPTKAIVSPAKPRRLLIFTLNVGYGGHPSIAYASEAFTRIGRKTGAFETEVSQDPSVFSRESLKRFDAVFFNNTVGNCFTNAHWRQNLLEFITGGGGLLGVHGTSVAFTRWPGAVEDWPEFGYLIGARGANHKDSDEQIWMKVEDPLNAITRVFGSEGFDYRDEFFRPQGTYSRERVRVLLSIDTSKCEPNKGQARGDCYRADNDYAVAWIRNYGRGRIFYCTIAHNPYVFWDSKMLQFYLGALQFALGDMKCPTTPSAKLTPAVLAQEQLGWKVALQAGHGRDFASDIDLAATLRLSYVAATELQPVGADIPKKFDPGLSDSELSQVRLKLETAGVRLISFSVRQIPSDRPSIKKLFEFGRKAGIETFIASAEPEQPRELRAFCKEYGIHVAVQGQGGGTTNATERDDQSLGLSLGFGDWLRAPDRFQRKLLVVQLGAEAGRPDELHPFVAEAAQRGLTPLFLVQQPEARAAIDQFDASCLKLQKRPL